MRALHARPVFAAFAAVLFLAARAAGLCVDVPAREACEKRFESGFACRWSGDWPLWRTGTNDTQQGICFKDPSLPAASVRAGTLSAPTVIEILQSDSNLRTFATLLDREGLTDIISGLGTPLTVFAPSEAAMAVLLSLMRTAGTLGDRPLRRMALLAHFVPSFIPEPALVDQSTIGTLAGPGSWLRPAVALPRTVPLTAANLVTVNAAPLTHAAQRASDGVVYVIDEPVLTPGRGLPTSESATRGPLTGPCRDLLAAVKSQCESQKCGSCHPAMCAAGGAIACHFRRVRTAGADRRGRTFRELTSGYGVCRKPCPTMRESLAILRRRDLIEESTTFEALRFYRNASEGARSEVSAFDQDVRAARTELQPCAVACVDVPPPDGHGCELQREWGKCDAVWMVEGEWCAETCGRCREDCLSLPLGAACTTTAVEGLRVTPCGNGLVCEVADEGDAEEGVPSQGTCVPMSDEPVEPAGANSAGVPGADNTTPGECSTDADCCEGACLVPRGGSSRRCVMSDDGIAPLVSQGCE